VKVATGTAPQPILTAPVELLGNLKIE
jgi:hypothetical protein